MGAFAMTPHWMSSIRPGQDDRRARYSLRKRPRPSADPAYIIRRSGNYVTLLRRRFQKTNPIIWPTTAPSEGLRPASALIMICSQQVLVGLILLHIVEA
jgi:hypothetical protein